jgi:hypothetical protein
MIAAEVLVTHWQNRLSVCAKICIIFSPSPAWWVAGVAKKVLCAEVVELTQPQHGLQFNASNATSKYLEGSFVQEAAGKMQKYAPGLWDLVHSLPNANGDGQSWFGVQTRFRSGSAQCG